MSQRTASPAFSHMGVANWVTCGRLFLAAVIFVILSLPVGWRFGAGFVLFVLASGSDWVDGFLARRLGQVSALGRVLDPFVDKILICGTLVFLAAEPALSSRPELLQPWMVVIVISRELLVTALRGWAEEQGHAFPAQTAGKVKMVLQSVASGAGLLYAALFYRGGVPLWLEVVLIVSVWTMMLSTVHSGVQYVWTIARWHRRA